MSVEGNLTLSQYQLTKTIPIDGTYSDSVIVSIPSLGGTDSLAEGSVYNLTISVTNSTSGKEYLSRNVQLLVQPLFIVESNDWPAIMEFQPQIDTNMGGDINQYWE